MTKRGVKILSKIVFKNLLKIIRTGGKVNSFPLVRIRIR